MENKTISLRDENGAIMVVAMILLAMLSIIGFMSISRTTTELDIAKNEIQYRNNFLRADAVSVVAMGQLQDLRDSDDPAINDYSLPWMYNGATTGWDVTNPSTWYTTDPNWWQVDPGNGQGINCRHVAGFQQRRPDGNLVFNTHYAAVANMVPGGSVGIGGNQLVKQFEVFSRYASEDGQVLVHAAYRVR